MKLHTCKKTINRLLVRGRLCLIRKKKVCFDFAIALCSISAPEIPKNFVKRSEMENSVFEPRPFLLWEN